MKTLILTVVGAMFNGLVRTAIEVIEAAGAGVFMMARRWPGFNA